MFTLVNHLSVAVGAQRDDHVVYANDALAALLEYESSSALLGRSIWEHLHPSLHRDVRQRLAFHLEGDDSPFRTTLVTTSGRAEEVIVFLHSLPEKWPVGARQLSPLLMALLIPTRALSRMEAPQPVVGELRLAPALSCSTESNSVRQTAHRSDGHARDWVARLTQRESQVMGAIAAGGSITMAAVDLGISPHTARNHLKAVFRKAGVRSQAELLSRLLLARR
jgi:DNA-binding CsgD family transcriptional regulator